MVVARSAAYRDAVGAPAEARVAATPERTYAAVLAAYAAVGIPVTAAIPGDGVVGLNGAVVRSAGGEPLSAFVSCGTDAVGAPLAERYRVTLWVLSQVAPAADGAAIRTRVFGTAQSVATSATTVTCASTGVLEARIAERARVGAAG